MRRQLGLEPHAPVAVFVGRLDYPPNLEAVKTLCIHIAPHCPNVTFLVAGINPPKIAPPNNVRLIGFVDQIESYLGAGDLAVVPITFGSGTRIKILDAWAAGLPVLSTSAAASGLEYQDGVNIVIEDDIQRFPERILELLSSPNRCVDLSRGALEAVKPYRWDAIGRRYSERLTALVEET
jgi:glycosyltransferase involved in cell wall biosynthesis